MNPPTVDYAALSYCWGGQQRITATKLTMKDLMSNVPYVKLPKTLQDAVTVTIKLGLRFLWVDALCIIQDDRTQTQREIAAMPNIYRNACVTISAARSRSCEEGFLHNIMAPGPTATAFKFQFYGPDCTVGSVVCFHSDSEYRYRNPITDRAWPLQEFILSRRILKFGGFQRSWLCLCDTLYDKESVGNWWKDNDIEEASLRRDFNKASVTLKTPGRENWSRLVELYSNLKVTNPADRLLAISGMAATLGEKTNDQYLAGIWREHFPNALLWYVPSIPAAKCDIYVAPSWSWAAVNQWVLFSKELPPDPELELLTKHIILSETEAPYGAVNYGSITVRGWIRGPLRTEGDKLFDPQTTDDGSGEMHATCFPDYSNSIPADFVVWCLQIKPYSEYDNVGPYGLILITKDGEVFYRRGMFEYDPVHYRNSPSQFLKAVWQEQSQWKDNCELRTIVIE